MEKWKDVPGYKGHYKISNLGRVTGKRNPFLIPSNDVYGYSRVVLCKNKTQKTFKVHQLVAITFLDHKPNGNTIVVDHINNIKDDNRLENLQLISNRENLTRKPRGKCKSVGVSKSGKKYVSHITLNSKLKYLGIFKTEIKASKAYQKALP